jgi:hypothetical protein
VIVKSNNHLADQISICYLPFLVFFDTVRQIFVDHKSCLSLISGWLSEWRLSRWQYKNVSIMTVSEQCMGLIILRSRNDQFCIHHVYQNEQSTMMWFSEVYSCVKVRHESRHSHIPTVFCEEWLRLVFLDLYVKMNGDEISHQMDWNVRLVWLAEISDVYQYRITMLFHCHCIGLQSWRNRP